MMCHRKSKPLDHVAGLVKRFHQTRAEFLRLRDVAKASEEECRRMGAESRAAEAELMAALGEADCGTVNGKPAVTRSVKRRRFGPPRTRLVIPRPERDEEP